MKMDMVISLLVLSTLPQLVAAETPSVTSFRAVVELTSGDLRIFSGESVRLKCSVPGVHNSEWKYLWFRGSDRLPRTQERLVLWKSKVKDSGKYYCQGVRNTQFGNMHTLKSLPVEINVDGGWAILKVPPQSGLVGDTLKVTCQLLVQAKLHEVILYKDGVEVMRQIGSNPHLYLTNLSLEDQGMYSCRASWDADGRTHSAISAEASVQVAEVLSQPFLEIVADNNLFPVTWMQLICHLQYNGHAPAPPIHFYFYKNKNRVATASSEKSVMVNRTPGLYSCKARVPKLGISRESEPRAFGQVTDLLPAAETTATRPSSHQSTAALAISHPNGVSIKSSYPPRQPQQSATSNFLSAVPSPDQTVAAMESDNTSGESDDTSGDTSEESDDTSGDTSGESDDMSGDTSEESDDTSEESDDTSEESDDTSEESDDTSEESDDTSGDTSGDTSEESDDTSGDTSEESDDTSGDTSEESDDTSGDTSEESDDTSGDTSEESDDTSGDTSEESDDTSGDTSEESDDMSGDTSEESDDTSGDTSEESDDTSGDTSEESDDTSGDTSEESDDMSGDTSEESFDTSGDTSEESDDTSGDTSEESDDIK
ncbi:uncharacterized protein AB9W97_008162 [Spinachia spinachia]